MPEIRFDITWPDGTTEHCYSPSLIVQDYFVPGTDYSIADFLERSRTALRIASERVAQKFGFPCSRALGQLASIEAGCARFSEIDGARVHFGSFKA
jgi:uncharacterized repeat protein (TIGR04042 family)